MFIPSGDLVLVRNKTGLEIALTEKDGSFIKKAGKPDKIESGKSELVLDLEYLIYKKLYYSKSWFIFHFPGGGITREGLRHFKIEDTLFSIKDKRRNVSLKVGDGLAELRKFYPDYSLTCNVYGGLDIRFIEHGKKKDEPLDDVIGIMVNKKIKKVIGIMTVYRQDL